MQQLHQSLATVQGNDSPGAKSVLEVLDGAQAAQAAGRHDANPRTQRLTLLHAMRRQNDCMTCRKEKKNYACWRKFDENPVLHWAAQVCDMHLWHVNPHQHPLHRSNLHDGVQ